MLYTSICVHIELDAYGHSQEFNIRVTVIGQSIGQAKSQSVTVSYSQSQSVTVSHSHKIIIIFSSSHSQDPKIQHIMYKGAQGQPHWPIIWYYTAKPVPAPGPLPPARSARLFFLGRWQTTLVGGPQKAHTPHGISIHVGLFESLGFLSFWWFTLKWDFATLPFDTYTHDRRYTCPGSFSGLMIIKRMWWCTMALPSAMVHLLSLPPNWILGWTDNFWPAVPVTLVPPFFLLWADRPLSLWTDRLS